MDANRYLKEGEVLVKRHDRMISAVNKALKENAAFGKEMDVFQKTNLAVMLENVERDFDYRAQLNEATGVQVGDIARKNDYLNLIAAVMPTLVAEEIVSVQPLKQKAGVVFYMKHVYDSNKGLIKQGDNISSFKQVGPDIEKYPSSIEYSSEDVTDEAVVVSSQATKLSWTPVIAGSVNFTVGGVAYIDNGQGKIVKKDDSSEVGDIDYGTGEITNLTVTPTEVSYQLDLLTAPVNVPAVKTVVTDITVTARPRKLKTGFSIDAAFDLMATQNIDLQTVLQATATDEIRSEIDGEILQDLRNSGTTLQVSFNQPVPFGISKLQHYEAFYQTIVEGANKIYNKTRRITGNFVIVGENAANIIETHPKFKAAASINEAGPHIMGTLGGRFLIVKNPYFGANDFVIGYKGDVVFDGGYVYAPYMPITATQFLMDETFYGRQGFATSYAKKLVANEFFCQGLITQITE